MSGSERSFTLADQLWFGALSGDRNPIHVDPDWSAVNFPGEVVVHGAFALLWAIDRAMARLPDRFVERIKVTFVQPILIGDRVRLEVDPAAPMLRLFVGDALMMVARLGLGDGPPPAPAPCPAAGDATLPLASRPFATLQGLKGTIPAAVDPAALAEAFPQAVAAMGPLMAAGLARISGLVGMECPGYRSMSSEYAIAAAAEVPADRLDYEVKRADRRFSRIELAVAGSGLQGSVTAYQGRDAPEPGAEEIAGLVPAGAFAGSEPLILGGSHGLGAAAARLLAAGGARPWLTWQRSPEAAERMRALIEAEGGACRTSRFDTADIEAGMAALAEGGWAGGQAYYFATPRILRRALAGDAAADLAAFTHSYVDRFAAFAAALRGLRGDAALTLFYPSDESVAQPPPNLACYAEAKSAGERLCLELQAADPKLTVVAGRLPRARTRQLQAIGPAEGVAAHEAILPWLARVQGG
jgi:NAD(P)-dependent dehydrogenase (short-subunit alcohol dehydrogenase family)